jgi:uncharacterized protein (DUF952 family)
MLYHIARLEEFRVLKSRGSYIPTQFPQDGFIHCSTKEQVVPVANNWFKNSADLVLLEIDEQKLMAEVKYENLEGGQDMYPHIYGEIQFSAITRYAFFVPHSSGFSFPTEWIDEI